MNWLIDNWMFIIATVAIVAMAITYTKRFADEPTNQQIANLQEWLKWAVTMAEKELGSGTGQLKLRMVYNMAVDRFDWIARCITFDTFSALVEDALIWMENQLSSNKAVSDMVKGGE